MTNKIVTINNTQKEYYEKVDLRNSKIHLKRYFELIDLNKFNNKITILDVGGGSGHFTKEVCGYLKDKNYEVEAYVIDTTKYESWDTFKDEITFCKGSVENIDQYLGNLRFDLIFCNRVFHHFVTDTYSETLLMMKTCMNKLQHQLSSQGRLCIMDYFYDGLLMDAFPSWIIYQCTSQKNVFLINLFRKLGSKSAGSGVCFQSEKMWRKLIDKCGLDIAVFERGWISPINIIKRIIFLCHQPIENNIFICTRR